MTIDVFLLWNNGPRDHFGAAWLVPCSENGRMREKGWVGFASFCVKIRESNYNQPNHALAGYERQRESMH